MTWAEFKKWAEEHGVKDNDEISYIDWSYEPYDVVIEHQDEEGRSVHIA